MSDYTPKVIPGHEFTYQAGATTLGGQVVHGTAIGTPPIVSPTGAASDHVVGVAAHDAISGQPLTVSRGGVQTLKAVGAITAWTPVKSAAAGGAAAWVTGTDNPSLVIGVAQATVADGALVDVLWKA